MSFPNAYYLPKWQSNTSYTSGALVLNPSGQIVQAASTFTSGATYNPGNWSIVNGATPSYLSSSWGLRPVIYYSGTSWPSRTLPFGYSGPVTWDSSGYDGVSGPTGGSDGDHWRRKIAN